MGRGHERGVQGLHALDGSGTRVTWAALLALADDVHQTVWGEFRAFHPGALEPHVTIRAIDSSYFEVESADVDVIQAIRMQFKDVRRAD